MAGGKQAPERAQQFRHIVEVQAGRRFIEQKQRAGPLADRALGQMSRQFQALSLASGESRHRLAEAQIVQADVGERSQTHAHLGIVGKKFQCRGHRQVEDVGNTVRREARTRQHTLENLRPVTPAIAVGTAQVDIREELHLHVLEAVAAAGGAASIAGIEAERAGGVLAFARRR